MQRSSDNDKTWIGFNTVVAGIAEGNIGIVCACAPSLHHVFKRFFGSETTIIGSKSTGPFPSFVSPSTGSRSQPEPSVSRTPQMASSKWMDGEDPDEKEARPAEAYEWQQKGPVLRTASPTPSPGRRRCSRTTRASSARWSRGWASRGRSCTGRRMMRMIL